VVVRARRAALLYPRACPDSVSVRGVIESLFPQPGSQPDGSIGRFRLHTWSASSHSPVDSCVAAGFDASSHHFRTVTECRNSSALCSVCGTQSCFGSPQQGQCERVGGRLYGSEEGPKGGMWKDRT
jgi:hypothetical protein